MKSQNCFSALSKNNQSQFKYAAILLMLMTLAAWELLFFLSCPISSHCWVSPSNCNILSRRLTSQPPAQYSDCYYHLPAHYCYEHSPETMILLLMLAPFSQALADGSGAAVNLTQAKSPAVRASVWSVTVLRPPVHSFAIQPPVTRYT